MDKQLKNYLERIEASINAMVFQKKFLTIMEASQYLDYSVNYLYKLTHLNIIPFYRPNGKKIFFLRTDLDKFILKHKCKSVNEIQEQTKLKNK